jgi:hypothetical protein
MNNRLELIANRILTPNQSAFVKGRYILESVVAAHKLIHGANRNKTNGLVLKLDYEKSYDMVSWQFVEELLIPRGFGSRWVNWIMSLVKNGSICVRLNDRNGPFF